MKTKREMFTEIRNAVADNEEMVAFLNKEIALLEKTRNNRKPTKTQVENEKYKKLILDYLIAEQTIHTLKEIQLGVSEVADFKCQKMTHLLTALINEKKITRNYVKKVPYYSAIRFPYSP